MSRRISRNLIIGFLVFCSVRISLAEQPVMPGTNDTFSPSQVYVLVKENNGWGRNVTSGLSGDGKFRLVGEYSDSTAIRGTVSQDTALVFINDLLAINYFELPEEFGSSRIRLENNKTGELMVVGTKTMDGGGASITLCIGEHKHVVNLRFPAYGAPKLLQDWLIRYRKFMNANRGW